MNEASDERGRDDRDDRLTMEGIVVDSLPASMFSVSVNEGTLQVTAVLSGKMRQNRIRVTVGDRVQLETSPYDLSKGRIVRRL